MSKLGEIFVKEITPNFIKKLIYSISDDLLNKNKLLFIRRQAAKLSPNKKLFILKVLNKIKLITKTSTTINTELKDVKTQNESNISANSETDQIEKHWEHAYIFEDIKNDNLTSIVISPHGIGDAINIISVIYELNKIYPNHKWIIACKEYIGKLFSALDIDFLKIKILNKKQVDLILANPNTYNLPATINTYEFIQFPRLDKTYINKDDLNVNENSLTNLNILGKISQSEGYLLLSNQLDTFSLLNHENNFLTTRIREIFKITKDQKVDYGINSNNELSLSCREFDKNKEQNFKLVYLLTKASSIESPSFKYIEDIIDCLKNNKYSDYKIMTNDIEVATQHNDIVYDPLSLFESIVFIEKNVDYIIGPVCGFLNLIISLGIVKNYLSLYPTKSNNKYQFGNFLLNPKNYFIQKTFDNIDYIDEILLGYNTEVHDENFKDKFFLKLKELLNTEIKYAKNSIAPIPITNQKDQLNENLNIELNTSAGEIIDKYVILKIKKRKINSVMKIKLIDEELSYLQEKVNFILDQKPKQKVSIVDLINELEEVNEQAWIKNEEIYFGFEGYFGSEDFNPTIEDLSKEEDLLENLINSAKNFRSSQAFNKKRVEIKNKITDIVSIGFLEGKSYQQDIYK